MFIFVMWVCYTLFGNLEDEGEIIDIIYFLNKYYNLFEFVMYFYVGIAN